MSRYSFTASGLTTDVGQIGNIVVASHDGAPVLRARRGAASTIGARDSPRSGNSSRHRRGGSRPRFHVDGGEQPRGDACPQSSIGAGAQEALPDDVTLEVVYDRTHLVDKVIETVRHNLVAGALLVVSVLFAFPREPARRANRGCRDPALDGLCGRSS